MADLPKVTFVHISYAYTRCKDDECIVCIPRDDSWKIIKRSQRDKPQYRHLRTLECSYWTADDRLCGKDAVQVDGHYPYFWENNRCKEHQDARPLPYCEVEYEI